VGFLVAPSAIMAAPAVPIVLLVPGGGEVTGVVPAAPPMDGVAAAAFPVSAAMFSSGGGPASPLSVAHICRSAPLAGVGTVSVVSLLPVAGGGGNWSPPATPMLGVGGAEPPAGVAAASAEAVLLVVVGGGGWPHPAERMLSVGGPEPPAGVATLSAVPVMPVVVGGGSWFLPAVSLSGFGGGQPLGAVASALGVSAAVAVPFPPAELGVGGLCATAVLLPFLGISPVLVGAPRVRVGGTVGGAVLFYTVLQDGFPATTTDMDVDSVHADVPRGEAMDVDVHLPESDV